ncbi:hypothetical protein RvY_15811 [Ramazzottius varieornatus]|uniref:Uncharacterized protein n=1 Tax=Ramazzottius varieornatus TaxID=947166 RepID=A0A1D1VW87_RAMVA|nr:hypothetical protein RvY_15811 [Ramazzottius varieornatus]
MSASYAVVLLTDGRVITHQLNRDPSTFISHIDQTLSSIPNLEEVTCMALSDKNVYFGTSSGDLGYFSLSGQRFELATQHTSAISSIKVKEPDALIVFTDAADEMCLYCLTTDACLPITNLAGKPMGVFFDWLVGPEQTEDFVSIFGVQTPTNLQFYAYIPHSINGAYVEEVEYNSKFSDKSSVLGISGESMALLSSGVFSVSRISLYPDDGPKEAECDSSSDFNNVTAEKLIRLHRYYEAAAFCRKKGMKDFLKRIGENCVRELNVELAVACFRESGDFDKALLLEQYVVIDHLPRLAGYMALVDGKPELAAQWFLKASDPLAVLGIYSDLMQWEKAIALAESHAADKVSYACQQYAAQLELLADYPSALEYYENALRSLNQPDAGLENQVKRGLARMCFRSGEMSRGIAIVQELKDRSLLEECAAILEDEKHLVEAAKMYRESGNLEKAASVFLRAKDWKAAEDIIEKVDCIPLKLQLGRARETLKDYAGAIKLYEAAGDNDSVVRLLLEALNRIDLAIEVVDRTRSQEGAKMVAAHFMKIKDFASAIRYLLISGRGEEAFLIAQQYNQMEIFSQVVGNDQTLALYEKIATYYSNKREFVKSAQYLIKADQSRKAVELLTKLMQRDTIDAAEEDFLLNTLVAAAVSSKDMALTDKVVQVLLGNDGGEPKDEKYLLDLYLLSGQHREADKIAVLVAEHHLDSGDYKEAHRVLYRTYIKLLESPRGPSDQLFNLFSLVHSHAVSVVMHTLKEHEKVARMLIRICKNISKFPKDASRFLLSAVLECTKCHLNKSAMEFALILMQPQYRAIVTQKYESKILNILRKGGRVVDAEEEATDCPFASHKLPSSQLFCPLCKLRVPFCVLSGMHLVRFDCAFCPGCDMPAIYSQVKSGLSAGLQACPMCSLVWSSQNMQPAAPEKTESFFRKIESSQLADG